jgi:hypothetical protein
VLEILGGLLKPTGRMLVGFRMVGGPQNANTYPADAFVADVEAAGLVVDARFDSFELRTGVDADYGVWVLSVRTRPAAPGSTA